MDEQPSAVAPAPEHGARLARLRALLDYARAHQVWLAAVVSVALLAGLVLSELIAVGTDLRRWDVLMLSGYSTVVVALWLVRGQRLRFERTVGRLAARGALRFPGSPDGGEHAFLASVERRAAEWSHRGGLAIALVMAISWPAATLARQEAVAVLAGTLASVVAGYIVGRAAGRLACYGRTGHELPSSAGVRVLPGHPDGAAGFKPFGDYYFSQALLLAIPAAFLLIWTLLIPFWDHGRYLDWRPWYQGLLAVALSLQLIVFVAPMWRLHREMARCKVDYLREADEISHEIADVRRELERDLDGSRRTALSDRLGRLQTRYHELEAMPTWPVDTRIRRRFTLNYLVLFLPLLGQWLDGNGSWESLAERLVG